MTRYLIISYFLCFSLFSLAQNNNANKTNLSEGVNLLFKTTKSKLTDAEKNMIFQDLKLKLSKDKKQFIIDEYPVNVKILPTDINKDDKEEIFVGVESSALYGNVGQNFSLYIKNSGGVYQSHTEIGGGIPIILITKNLGYPDILIGGPGMEFPVYRWDGKKYLLNRKMKDGALNSKNSTDIEAYSKTYTSAAK